MWTLNRSPKKGQSERARSAGPGVMWRKTVVKIVDMREVQHDYTGVGLCDKDGLLPGP